MGDPAESESVKAFKYKWLLAVYKSLFPGWVLKYLTIQSTTSLYWLTTLKENIGIWLSNGRIIFPTKQRYHLRLENNFGFVSCSPLYTLCSGVCPLFVFSMNYTHTHSIFWQTNSFHWGATSIPKKLPNFIRSLVWNKVWRNAFNLTAPFLSSLVIMMPSL